jgi:hypothetical protein
VQHGAQQFVVADHGRQRSYLDRGVALAGERRQRRHDVVRKAGHVDRGAPERRVGHARECGQRLHESSGVVGLPLDQRQQVPGLSLSATTVGS